MPMKFSFDADGKDSDLDSLKKKDNKGGGGFAGGGFPVALRIVFCSCLLSLSASASYI